MRILRFAIPAAIVLVIGGIWAVDKLQKPPSECESTELGCELVKGLKDDGTIDSFESKDPEGEDISTFEINDDDSFVLHLRPVGYEVAYPEDEEELATEIDEATKAYQPPKSELSEVPK